MKKVIYIPLDERTCNYKYPGVLAELTDDIELLVPPRELMGSFRIPADVEKLWDWVFQNISQADYAILSIDTLVYGNIVNSRLHQKTKPECAKYTKNIKKIKEVNPEIELHVFNLVPRVANYNNNSEEPLYWEKYGTKIWKYSYFTDKITRGEIKPEEVSELEEIKNDIPPEILEDFLKRREVNSFVTACCLDLVEEGIIDQLVIPKDDTAKYGLAAVEQRGISQLLFNKRIMDKVMVYPGADEVGCILLARVFNRIKGFSPRVYIRYSSTMGPGIIPKYEDRPLHEGIKAQITSVGGLVVESPAEADLLLAVNSPGKEMLEAAEQFNKDVTYYSYSNTTEFLNYLDYFIQEYQKPVALADTAFCNGADNEFISFALKKGIIGKISSYCGWNTSQNTVGLTLSHANICSYYNNFEKDQARKRLSRNYLLNHLIESWLFEANIMYELWSYTIDKGIDPYKLKENREEIQQIIQVKLNEKLNQELASFIGEDNLEIKNLSLPWDRIFDIDFEI